MSDVDAADLELLLARAWGKDRTWVIAHAGDAMPTDVQSQYEALLARRRSGEPLAYILGDKEFYGRIFHVRSGVLIPRPCTEELVTTALAALDGKHIEPVRNIDEGIVCVTRLFGSLDDVELVVDTCTGSGCIAVTLACERPNVRVIGTDISHEALFIARENAALHGVQQQILCRSGSLLEYTDNVREPFLLVSNPPYVANEALLAPDVRAHEPMIALMGGGGDGADILRELVKQAKSHPFCRGIVVECLVTQAEIVLEN